jgi:hypothetical protein
VPAALADARPAAEYYVAQVGASAALTGLIFVVLSFSRLSLVLAGCLATTAGSLALAAGWTSGTYVLAAGALISPAIGLVIAWFLLVEVRRATT